MSNYEPIPAHYSDPTPTSAARNDLKQPKPGEVWTDTAGTTTFLVLSANYRGRVSGLLLSEKGRTAVQFGDQVYFTSPDMLTYLTSYRYGERIGEVESDTLDFMIGEVVNSLGLNTDGEEDSSDCESESINQDTLIELAATQDRVRELEKQLAEATAVTKASQDEPANVGQHRNLCQGLNELYARKNHDYGDSFHKTWEDYGPVMLAIRLDDKLGRFKKLLKAEARVKDEGVRDTLLDLANYAIMGIMELDRGKA